MLLIYTIVDQYQQHILKHTSIYMYVLVYISREWENCEMIWNEIISIHDIIVWNYMKIYNGASFRNDTPLSRKNPTLHLWPWKK